MCCFPGPSYVKVYSTCSPSGVVFQMGMENSIIWKPVFLGVENPMVQSPFPNWNSHFRGIFGYPPFRIVYNWWSCLVWGCLGVYQYACNFKKVIIMNLGYNSCRLCQAVVDFWRWGIHEPRPDSHEPIALEGPWVVLGLQEILGGLFSSHWSGDCVTRLIGQFKKVVSPKYPVLRSGIMIEELVSYLYGSHYVEV